MNAINKIPAAIRYPLLVLLVLLLLFTIAGLRSLGQFAAARSRGGQVACTTSSAFGVHPARAHSLLLLHYWSRRVSLLDTEPERGLAKVHTPGRIFWAHVQGEDNYGPAIPAYLLTELNWLAQQNPSHQVRAGDVVIDCGAHIGVFTHTALQRGAARVIAIEPEPTNLECLRRNFAPEIAAGRVIIVPKAAWSSEKTLQFSLSGASSGMNSAVIHTGETMIDVPAARIDTMVAELGLERVDFIKMDIEGAEREALKGASETLRRFKPRLMLDYYHLPDDPVVLPRIIRAARPDYQEADGPCHESHKDHWAPYAKYFR